MRRAIGRGTLAAAAILAACSPTSGSGGGGPSLDGGGDATFPDTGANDAAGGTTLAECIGGALEGPLPMACTELVQCLEANCPSQLVAAFGNDLDSGTIGGDCQSFESCAMQNACTTAAGVSCASGTSSACQADLEMLVACMRGTSCKSYVLACTTGLLEGLGDGGTPPIDAGTDSTVDAGGHDAAMDTGSDGTAMDAGDAAPPSPGPIGVDPSGYVFVGPDPTSMSSNVLVYSPSPAFQLVQVITQTQVGLADAGTPLLSPNGPQAFAFDTSGHLFIANYYETANSTGCYYTPPGSYGSDIARYLDGLGGDATPSLSFDQILIGNPVTAMPPGCADGVAAAAGGDLFVSTGQVLYVYDATGATITSIGYPATANVSGVAVAPGTTNAYAPDYNNGAVYEYQLNGTTLTLARTISVNGGHSEPGAIAIDGAGNVYVADWLGQTIDVYTPAGATMGTPISVGCSAWLAFDASGQLYASCRYGQIDVYAYQAGAWSKVHQF
jgi:sugar lactone lactonase YvrE